MIIPDENRGGTERLYPHASDNLIIFTGIGGQMPFYLYLFLTFRLEVWITFIFTLISLTIGWSIIGSKSYKSWFNKFINLLRVITGGSLPGATNGLPERILMIFCLLFSTILITAFTSKLASSLIQERHYPDENTLEDVTKSKKPVFGYQSLIAEIATTFKGTAKVGLLKKMEPYPPKYNPVSNVQVIDWNALILDCCIRAHCILNYERAMSILQMSYLGPLGHIVKESLIPNFVAFQVPNGSPLLDELNKYLKRIVENGLYIYWKRDYEYQLIRAKIAQSYDSIYSKIVPVKALSLMHIQGAFIILVTGYVISAVAFLGEILCSAMKRKFFRGLI